MKAPKTPAKSTKSNATGRGGRRAGAGRPKKLPGPGASGRPTKLTAEHQQKVRDLIVGSAQPGQLARIIVHIYALAEQGERWAVEWLMAWHAGKVPDEVKLSNADDSGFKVVISQAAYDAV